MKALRIIGITLWRIWFYLVASIPIFIMLPFLLLTTAKEKFYRGFFVLAKIWANIIIYGTGLRPKIDRSQKLEKNKSYMLVANHTSILDIMLMLHMVKNPFVFVGKQELVKIPIFGFFYKRTCILVDRKSNKSKREVFEHAQRRLKQGNSICIFPEGGVSDDENLILDIFHDGAFRLAIEHQIPIVPMVFFDNKKRFPYTFLKGGPGKMRAKVLPFISTEGKTLKDKLALRNYARGIILKELETDQEQQ